MLIKELQKLQAEAQAPVAIEEDAITERYEESADFDADIGKVHDLLYQAQAIIQSTNWKQHMHDTDSNFDTSAKEMSRRAEEKLKLAIDAYSKLYDHMMEAT
jgi:hypothetical protein